MRFTSRLALYLALAMVVVPSHGAAPDGYRLTWSDEFEGTALDTNKWVYHQPGKRRDALNVKEAVTVARGTLTITSYTEEGKHYTGFISTRGKFMPVHGYWEARIQFEDTPGEWSAFWVHTPTMGRPMGDPGKAGVEIDVCEHRVVDQNGASLVNKVQHTLHWDGYKKGEHKSKGQMSKDLGLGSGFHTYAVEWTTNEYRFLIDGQVSWTATNAISHAPEFCLLSSEIQDKGWAGNIPAGGFGTREQSKTRMTVDWVRYYSRE